RNACRITFIQAARQLPSHAVTAIRGIARGLDKFTHPLVNQQASHHESNRFAFRLWSRTKLLKVDPGASNQHHLLWAHSAIPQQDITIARILEDDAAITMAQSQSVQTCGCPPQEVKTSTLSDKDEP